MVGARKMKRTVKGEVGTGDEEGEGEWGKQMEGDEEGNAVEEEHRSESGRW